MDSLTVHDESVGIGLGTSIQIEHDALHPSRNDIFILRTKEYGPWNSIAFSKDGLKELHKKLGNLLYK